MIEAHLLTDRAAVVVGGSRGIGKAVSELLAACGALESHMWTVFQTCRAAAPRMAQQRSGAIVNTSSFAFLGDYGGIGYPAGQGRRQRLHDGDRGPAQRARGANVVCPGAKTRLSSGPAKSSSRQVVSWAGSGGGRKP